MEILQKMGPKKNCPPVSLLKAATLFALPHYALSARIEREHKKRSGSSVLRLNRVRLNFIIRVRSTKFLPWFSSVFKIALLKFSKITPLAAKTAK
jgi:hypothetical protein